MPGRKLPRKRGKERWPEKKITQMKLEQEKVLKLSRFSRSKEKINALLPIVKHISFRNQAGKWSNFQVGLTTQDMHPREIRKSSPDFTQLASRFFPDIFLRIYCANLSIRMTNHELYEIDALRSRHPPRSWSQISLEIIRMIGPEVCEKA